MLKIINLTKAFNDQIILNNINLSVGIGEIIGLAGSSGSGKSTLLRCIQKLEIPNSGKVNLDGLSGFMFQDFQLFPHLTVLENIVYAPKINKRENYSNKAKELLQKLNIDHRANHYPSQLSGGQKQRVALARAIIMMPSILLCDEPTSGLDLATIDDVVKLLKDAMTLTKMSIIIASHDLDFLTRIADRIIVLKSGSIVFEVKEVNEDMIPVLKKFYYD